MPAAFNAFAAASCRMILPSGAARYLPSGRTAPKRGVRTGDGRIHMDAPVVLRPLFDCGVRMWFRCVPVCPVPNSGDEAVKLVHPPGAEYAEQEEGDKYCENCHTTTSFLTG